VQSGLRLDNPLRVATLQRLPCLSLGLGELGLGALFGLLKRDALGILCNLSKPGILGRKDIRRSVRESSRAAAASSLARRSAWAFSVRLARRFCTFLR
jgi:hypothetical protein